MYTFVCPLSQVSSQTVKTEPMAPAKQDELLRVLSDVNQVKLKQDSTDSNLEYIKR